MLNFGINFTHPWLLLLLIPALALTLLTYFLLNKRYRRTRNRVISMTLHMIVMTLAILVLSGITFTYQISNPENELILLVDVSDTEETSADRRDDLVATLLDESALDGLKVGVVTFGFTQEYAVPLTYEAEEAYDLYRNAPLPDTTATDIAAALRYARGLFGNPETGKIVLITDGKETDEAALDVIRSVSAQGIKVDAVNIGSSFEDDNVQVVGVEFPNYHINVGETFTIGVSIRAKESTQSTVVEIYDNGNFDSENGIQTVNLASGSQVVSFQSAFATEGLHQIRVKVTETSDGMHDNNEYYSYFYLDVYDKVLIIDQGMNPGESDALTELLTSGEPAYDVTQLHLHTDTGTPTTVEELRAYDQIILNNIANSDLTPYGLDELLYTYVYEYGGGLFTTGGTNDGVQPHAYDRLDLNNTLFQEMLPVQAINYTPPVGVMIVIDISGSMAGDKLEWAKNGAINCLSVLTDRDYVGIMTLDTDYGTVLQLTSRTEQTAITEAIQRIGEGGSTTFSTAIKRAAEALISEKRVDRRHVVIVTDGEPTEPEESYLGLVRQYHTENEISFSVVGIQVTSSEKMETLVQEGGGRLHITNSEHDVLSDMREDLNAPEIKDFDPTPFHPYIANALSPVVYGVEYGVDGESRRAMAAQLGGFYGVKARASADVILVGDYEVPIYAQWKFGQGMVGSFMCDAGGQWSSSFLADPNGGRLLRNAVGNLMPTQDIHPQEIGLVLREDNYINQLSIYTELNDGETIEGKIVRVSDEGEETVPLNSLPLPPEEGGEEDPGFYVTSALSADNRFTRCTFVVKESGVYRIEIVKRDAEGNTLASAETYKSFAFSKEYELEPDETEFDPAAFLTEIADRGRGSLVAEEDWWQIFDDFITELDRVFDPRLAFMITAMVLFLADIAVRKFKFKWPHELIREHRERRASEKS